MRRDEHHGGNIMVTRIVAFAGARSPAAGSVDTFYARVGGLLLVHNFNMASPFRLNRLTGHSHQALPAIERAYIVASVLPVPAPAKSIEEGGTEHQIVMADSRAYSPRSKMTCRA